MALTVETGGNSGGTTGAESYVAVSDADTYWLNRNNTDWAKLTTPQKESALRVACTYLDGAYRWQGHRCYVSQPLFWPRVLYLATDNQLVPSTSIPTAIKNAQMELALLASAGDLTPPRDGQKISSEQVGALQVSYFQTDPTRVFPIVDLIVKDYTNGKTLGGLVSNAVLS